MSTWMYWSSPSILIISPRFPSYVASSYLFLILSNDWTTPSILTSSIRTLILDITLPCYFLNLNTASNGLLLASSFCTSSFLLLRFNRFAILFSFLPSWFFKTGLLYSWFILVIAIESEILTSMLIESKGMKCAWFYEFVSSTIYRPDCNLSLTTRS